MRQPEPVDPDKGGDFAPPRGDIEAILNATHGNAFSVLGIQKINGHLVARCFLPGAESVEAFDGDMTEEQVSLLAKAQHDQEWYGITLVVMIIAQCVSVESLKITGGACCTHLAR